MAIALIDGDVLAHLACEGRMQGINALEFVKHEFKEQFLRQLDIDGPTLRLLTLHDIEFTPEQDAAYAERAWKVFLNSFKDCMEGAFATEHRMAMKGHSNFRDRLTNKYKASRTVPEKKRNKFVPMIRARSVKEGMAEFAVDMEADDLLRIWYEEYKSKGVDTVICSIDKDLKCMPTQHYNIKKVEHFNMTEVASNLFYYSQLMQGDHTDSIPGISKVGPKKADALLAGCTTEEEMQKVVTFAYYYHYGARWQAELTLTGKLIYLLKTHDDSFDLARWPQFDLDEDTIETQAIREVVKVDKPMTVESALEVIDPKSIVGANAWNKAMEFLMLETAKLGDNEDPALGALEVITTRGKVPPAEILAHDQLKAWFAGIHKEATTGATALPKFVPPVAPETPVKVSVPPAAPAQVFSVPRPTGNPPATPTSASPVAPPPIKAPPPITAPKVVAATITPTIAPPVAAPLTAPEKPKFSIRPPGT